MSADNITDQLVAAGKDPVRSQLSIMHIVHDRPRIINIFLMTDNESIVHFLHFFHIIYILAL